VSVGNQGLVQMELPFPGPESTAGMVVAGGDREGREAEAGRAVPKIESGQNARFLSFYKEEGDV